MYGVEVLGGDVDTLAAISVGEDVQVRIADHTGDVSGEGGQVTVSFLRCKLIGIVQVMHDGGR